MREIIFKGKRVDNGEWVYGFLCEIDCINSIDIDNSVGFKTSDKFEVIPESVCMSFDLHDYNGDPIFTGDIVECYDYSSDDPNWGLDKKHSGIVRLIGNVFTLEVGGVFLDYWINAERINIVGNIYDKLN